MCLDRLEEIYDLLLLDAAFVKSEQAVHTRQPSDDRHMVPVEVKLDDGRLSFWCPSPNSGGAFADARLVDKDDQSSFSLSIFFRAGQVRRFRERTASSLRSNARFSGFYGLKPLLPRMRHTLAFSNIATGDIACELTNGCHELRKYQ